jgi:hypothetical protein
MYLDDIVRVFGITDSFEEQQIVSSLILVLYIVLIGLHTLFPSVKLIVAAVGWPSQPEEVVALQADAGGEITRFQQGLGNDISLVGDTAPVHLRDEVLDVQLLLGLDAVPDIGNLIL